MPVIATALPAWVQGIRDFQRLGLVNKAGIDVTAVDIPFIAMAKNKTEQKERILRQALVLAIAFILAPLHGRLIGNYMSRHVGLADKALNQTLMQLSYKELGQLTSFQAGVKKLFKTTLKQPLPEALFNSGLTDALRTNVIKAKSYFLRVDLAIEGLLFSLIGPAKVLFGQWLSGKTQFTGEFGIVEQKTLDKLYAKQAEKKSKQSPWQQLIQRYKTPITTAIGVAVPLLWATVLHRSFKTANPTQFTQWFRSNVAPHFDYHYSQFIKAFKGIPMLSDGSIFIISVFMQLSELIAARSQREVKEVAIQRSLLDLTFFLGIPAFMRLLSGSTSVQGAIDKQMTKAAQQEKILGEAAIQNIGRRSGLTYAASYLLACAAIVGSIALGNHLTRKGVKNDAKALEQKEQFLKLSKRTKLYLPFANGGSHLIAFVR